MNDIPGRPLSGATRTRLRLCAADSFTHGSKYLQFKRELSIYCLCAKIAEAPSDADQVVIKLFIVITGNQKRIHNSHLYSGI